MFIVTAEAANMVMDRVERIIRFLAMVWVMIKVSATTAKPTIDKYWDASK
jgi:hypothetical protein